MTTEMRAKLVNYLMLRTGSDYSLGQLTFKTDAELRSEVAELALAIKSSTEQGMLDLKEAGLWPVPEWLKEVI